MAAVLFLLAGVGTFSSTLLPAGPNMQPAVIMLVSIGAVAVGGIVWFLPWQRWSQRASLWLVPVAFVLIALGNHFAGAEPFRYGIFFVVAFTWIGIAHPLKTSSMLAPAFVAAYLLPLLTTNTISAASLASLLIVGPICLAIGESVAWVSARLRATEFDLHRMNGERYFRSLIQNSSDLVMILDEAGLIRYESPAAERLLGRRSGSGVGESPLGVVHPEDVARVEDALGRVLGTPDAEERLEFRVRHVKGSWHAVEAICKNLLAEEHVMGIVVNYRDVSVVAQFDPPII